MDPKDDIEPVREREYGTNKKGVKLDEKDFVQEKKGPNPFPVWIFFAVVAAIFSILWSGSNWYIQTMEAKIQESPFLKVTNREFSLFLWQNPEYMRSHWPNKTGYLPGFHFTDRPSPKLDMLDQYVNAPPEVLFRYHTWKRLLGNYVPPRPVSAGEFEEFLAGEPEWDPKNWKEAPEAYKSLVANLGSLKLANLQDQSKNAFPKEVRIAFLGWKNYFKEGGLINGMRPTAKEMQKFLGKYPNYSPNFWLNLDPGYLKSMQDAKAAPETKIPNSQLTPFLRVAFYNDQMASKELGLTP